MICLISEEMIFPLPPWSPQVFYWNQRAPQNADVNVNCGGENAVMWMTSYLSVICKFKPFKCLCV